ncbi:MAG: helix-turn-helix transcriptional regulator [Lachnospiraceae bacterium]|nr:helix-turn-helix transcriptional regulator [Lachnospiraceae bacterium]
MNSREQLIQLRKRTGMNRKQFCEYFGIPYRTMTDWELGNRTMPDYLLRLMAYKVEMEQLHGGIAYEEQRDCDFY